MRLETVAVPTTDTDGAPCEVSDMALDTGK